MAKVLVASVSPQDRNLWRLERAVTKVTAGNMSNCRFGRRNNAEEQEFSGFGSVGSLDPVEREVGDRGGGVVGDEMRFVVDVGELDAIGVPRRVAADTLHELLGE